MFCLTLCVFVVIITVICLLSVALHVTALPAIVDFQLQMPSLILLLSCCGILYWNWDL